MITRPDEIAPVLQSLIEICRDGQRGYRAAAEAMDNDGHLQSLLIAYSHQRARFAAALEAELATLGAQPEPTSTFLGTLHRGWLHLATAVSSKDPRVILTECERGETAALAQYQKSLDAGLPVALEVEIASQQGEISAALNAVKEALAAFPPLPQEAVAETLKTRTRDLASAASDSLRHTKEKVADALETGERLYRKNPVPLVLTAFGLGIAAAIIFRAVQQAMEPPPRSRMEQALDRAAHAVDIRPYVLPFIWPAVQTFRRRYRESARALKKAYDKSSKAVGHAEGAAEEYLKPAVNRIKSFF